MVFLFVEYQSQSIAILFLKIKIHNPQNKAKVGLIHIKIDLIKLFWTI